MSLPHPTTQVIALIAVLLAVLAAPARSRAEPPDKLKTQKVAIRVAEHGGPRPEFELVQIPAGTIELPDAGKPVKHAVKAVWIARYETRWDEYDVFWQALDLPNEGRQRDPEARKRMRTEMPYLKPGDKGYPVDCVGFRAARRYCAWLSENTGKRFRLPTEAEWEYACRAGGPPVKPDVTALDAVSWYRRNAADLPYGARPGTRFDDDYGHTHPVGQKKPNAWGLYDMLGNVGEYVVRDPKDDKGLLAGGSYKDDAKDVHSGAREPYSKEWIKNDPQYPPSDDWLNQTIHHAGFRVVMEE